MDYDYEFPDDYPHEIEYGYFKPYCAGCNVTFFYLEESIPGGRSSEAVNCPTCGGELGNAEEDSKLLAQVKGDLSRVDLDEFTQALDDEGRRKLEAGIGTPAQREAKYQEFLERMKAEENPSLINIPTDERMPSQVTDDFWIRAHRSQGEYPEHTTKGGKWLVFAKLDEIDEWWEEIKTATEAGKLGGHAKVATACPSSYDPNKKVICVYTYDGDDEEDVTRVRQELRALGVTWPCSYKTDEDTRQGKYSASGHRVSKYRI